MGATCQERRLWGLDLKPDGPGREAAGRGGDGGPLSEEEDSMSRSWM